MPWIRYTGEFLIYVSFASSIIFLTLYTLWYRWWRWTVGRMIALLDLGVAITLLPSVTHFLFGFNSRSTIWQIIALSGLVIVPTIIISRTVWLWKNRRRSIVDLFKDKKDSDVSSRFSSMI